MFKKNISVILRFLFFLGIGVFFIWLFLRNLTTDQKHDILDAIKLADYSWILLSVILGLISHYIRALRWRILMEPMGYKPRIINTYMAVFVGYLANLALPRLGEVSRCGVLTKTEKIPFNKAFGTVITERVIDMLSFIALFTLMIFTMSEKISTYVNVKVYEPLQNKLSISINSGNYILLTIGLIVVILVITGFLLRKKFKKTKIYLKSADLVSGFIIGIRSLTRINHPVRFLSYTLLIWSLYLLMAYVVFYSLPETSGLGLGAGLVVLVFGSIGIMIVQGGIGIYPAIVAETLFLYSVPSTTGYAMGWLIWSSQNVMIMLGGVFSLLLLNSFKKNGHDNPPSDRAKDSESTNPSRSTPGVELKEV